MIATTGIVGLSIGDILIGGPHHIIGWYNQLLCTTTIDPMHNVANNNDWWWHRRTLYGNSVGVI